MFNKFFKILQKRRGFTIVELLVSMTLFVTIVSIVSGVFIKSLRTQRMTVALIAANSNAELAIEQMAREIQTGIFFNTLAGESNSIVFENAEGQTVLYCFINSNGSGWIGKLETGSTNCDEMTSGDAITAEDVKVNDLKFIVNKGTPVSPYPARVTMILKISAPGAFGPDYPVINIQTTVSSRNF